MDVGLLDENNKAIDIYRSVKAKKKT
jgi:hypothetical protein